MILIQLSPHIKVQFSVLQIPNIVDCSHLVIHSIKYLNRYFILYVIVIL